MRKTWVKFVIAAATVLFSTRIHASMPTTLAITGPAEHALVAKQKIERLLPKGWTVDVAGNEVVVRRHELVTVYNAVALPRFETERELKDYVRPHLRSLPFEITLRFDRPLNRKEALLRMAKNRQAEDKAARDAKDEKTYMPEFLEQHPEYGYRELPTFADADQSIYPRKSVTWQYKCFADDVGRECNAVENQVRGLFRPFDNTLLVLDLSSGFTDASLRPYVGRRITVIGVWNPRGKLSGFVRGEGKSHGQPIYIKATEDRGTQNENTLYKTIGDGAPIEVSGVLHLYQPPARTESEPSNKAEASAIVSRHYYFDVEKSKVSPLDP